MTATRIMDPAGRVLAEPRAYSDEARLHEALAQLRAHAPVSWVDVPPYAPFWAITKHADVMDIERDNELFTNDPRPFLEVAEFDEKQRAEREAGVGLRTLIHTDDPHHRDLRKIGADWFKPSALKALKIRCDELAKIWVDKMAEKGPELDFAQDIAVNYPLYRDPDAAGHAGVGLRASCSNSPRNCSARTTKRCSATPTRTRSWP